MKRSHGVFRIHTQNPCQWFVLFFGCDGAFHHQPANQEIDCDIGQGLRRGKLHVSRLFRNLSTRKPSFAHRGISFIENSASSTETCGKFPVVAGRAGVLQFPVLAIAAKHSFSLPAMCLEWHSSASTPSSVRAWQSGKQRPPEGGQSKGVLRWAISVVESGDLLSGTNIFPSSSALAANGPTA
jgi:hypothetical protein